MSNHVVRIASINVFFVNRSHRRVLEFIRTAQPDAVVLLEVTSAWRAALAALECDYPYAHSAAEPSERSVLILSRRPLTCATVVHFEGMAEPALLAALEFGGRTLRIIAAHATWPMGLRNFSLRNRQLARIAQLARATPAPLIVIGDLNITARSPHFRELLAAGALQSAANGFGYQPTWPTFLPLFGIQIDHCLVSSGIAVQRFARGPRVGSDHRPIVVDLSL